MERLYGQDWPNILLQNSMMFVTIFLSICVLPGALVGREAMPTSCLLEFQTF